MKAIIILAFCATSLWAVPLEKPQAQMTSRKIGGRIIGGAVARADQFPFAASVRRSTAQGTYFCGATLISNEYVLTAGSCVQDAVLFQVRLGTIYASTDDINAVLVSTADYHLHPVYDADTREADVGIIRFRQPVTLTNYLSPVSGLGVTDLPGQWNVVIYGWGATSDIAVQLSEELQWVYVTSVTSIECSNTYGGQILDSMICVEGQFNEGSCAGDIGGPLIWYQSTSRPVHVGIASFISTNGCESTDPSGYIKTSHYYDWISNTTGIVSQ